MSMAATIETSLDWKSIRETLLNVPTARPTPPWVKYHNVVGVTDFGTTEDGAAFLVMEHLRGESLAALCKREAPLAYKQAVAHAK